METDPEFESFGVFRETLTDKPDSLALPENIKSGGPFPQFAEAVLAQKIKPETITLSSSATGHLEFVNQVKNSKTEIIFIYQNKRHPEAQVNIEINTRLGTALITDITPRNFEARPEAEAPKENQPTVENKSEENLSITKMEGIIAQENKIGIKIDKKITFQDKDEPLAAANFFLRDKIGDDIQKFNPTDFIIYSEQFGILRFSHRSELSLTREASSSVDYYWTDKTGHTILTLTYYEANRHNRALYLTSLKKDGSEIWANKSKKK
jgi:hypothetical protein